MADDLQVNERITIPGGCLRVETARASGPGGQHVNTTETKVHLFLDLSRAPLPAGAMLRLREARAGDISQADELRVTCSTQRSMHQNLEEARKRLVAIIRAQLVPPIQRRATRPTRGSIERRVTAKKQRSATKNARGQVKEGES